MPLLSGCRTQGSCWLLGIGTYKLQVQSHQLLTEPRKAYKCTWAAHHVTQHPVSSPCTLLSPNNHRRLKTAAYPHLQGTQPIVHSMTAPLLYKNHKCERPIPTRSPTHGCNAQLDKLATATPTQGMH